MFGTVSKCVICDNVFKTVEADHYPAETTTGKRFAEVFASRASSPVTTAAKRLIFSKRHFRTAAQAEVWAEKNGFVCLAHAESSETHSFLQAPASWFKKTDFPRALRLDKGVLAEIGVRLPDFAKKQATADDMTAKAAATAATAATPKTETEKVETPNFVQKCENGSCPMTHPIKWAGKCWTMKAAAKGFPGDKEAAQHGDTAAPKAEGVAPVDGKCPASNPVLRDGMCHVA
jgi:hypothetical protein